MRASQGILEHWRIHHQDVEERVCLNLNVSVHMTRQELRF